MLTRVLALLIVAGAAACRARTTSGTDRAAAERLPASPSCTSAEASAERDDIYQLLAYAIVSVRWQDDKSRQGHNIGAVLVRADGGPVYWATNANFAEASAAEHAEARVIRNYLARRRQQGHPAYRLTGDTIYTTLEPCAMCVGTMAMTGIGRVVYGQTDPRYGKASERLRLDSRWRGGFGPYPHVPESHAASLRLRERLEAAYHSSGVGAVTAWLETPAAHSLFEEARQAFEQFQPRCPGNDDPLRRAHSLYRTAAPQAVNEREHR
jgi:tRNA(Arg) A34 adenosine deaminase TadA